VTALAKGKPRPAWPDWYGRLRAYRVPSRWRSLWQLTNTLVPYAAMWALMALAISQGMPVLALLPGVIAAGLLVRVFIFFHDCVHGSYFRSPRWNRIIGHLLGLLVFTAFDDWRYSHLRHHATYGNLDSRGIGDVWTMTLEEYRNASRVKRSMYRAYRNPLVTFVLGSVVSFVFVARFATLGAGQREKRSVLLTNALLVCVGTLLSLAMGWRSFLIIQLGVLWIAAMAGVWLFFVQHQFRGVYWERQEAWEPLRAAMEGSSFYRLPAVLRWFSGSIGYHHVHHLSPRIPNYRLKACYEAIPALRDARPLTIWRSLGCPRLKLWDEREHQLVPFPRG